VLIGRLTFARLRIVLLVPLLLALPLAWIGWTGLNPETGPEAAAWWRIA
jgi:hypothetical protein